MSNFVDIYAVHQGDNDVSVGHPAWWFLSKQVAYETAKGRGWYGSEAPVANYKAIEKDGKYYILKYSSPVIIGGPDDGAYKRTVALNKLTKEDKKTLGLS